MDNASAKHSLFLKAVELRNYKSIANCRVQLGALSILVGANGSGKSNFLDALRFVSDSLRETVDHALRQRGGINEVRRRSGGHPNHFSILLEFQLKDASHGKYRFRVGARTSGGFEVQEEECVIYPPSLAEPHRFLVQNGQVIATTLSVSPAGAADRLYLVNASGTAEFRPVYDAFSAMAFFNFNPEVIRDLQTPDMGTYLFRDGRNLASVLSVMGRVAPLTKARVEEYLSKVVPGITNVDAKGVGPKETLEFRQIVSGARNPWRFLAGNMSDGTLRALAILTALFHNVGNSDVGSSLVGIEEPEVALHPAASAVLRESLLEASRHVQVIITSHSPELLDDSSIDPDVILAVVSDNGTTRLGPLSEMGRSALRDRLYTAGELLRMNQLEPACEETMPLPLNGEGLS